MENNAHRAIAIVGLGAILPDAPSVSAFWENVKKGRYSITDVAPERWNPALYFDPDPAAPDKSYSKIGGWVREYSWEPMKWHLAVPPKVADAMDVAQKWAIACTREALEDYGYPKRSLNADRTGVILGNAMAGEKHYLTALRVYFPEFAHELAGTESFAALPEPVRHAITREMHERMRKHLPEITEDSMPGELANCIAGRIANIFNFHGPNYVVDAACASAMAAMTAAIEGLVENDYDAVVTGGIDRNMGASTYVKFCKIGALSATGTRPYAEGADGFVMGEGAAIFLLKRLADAERDQDKIYAVIRGMGASSDGKGKGITAPNPIGQKLAVERAWQNAGLSPASATYIEGHGTSTRVGDVVEVQSMVDVLTTFNLPRNSVALGSVKSNIGHLKGAAGAAGLLKTALALKDKVLPPSIHCEHRNPDIDFSHSPIYVNTELKPWSVPDGTVRCAGASAFGFGGTNFHAVLEEYIPHRLNGNGKRSVLVGEIPAAVTDAHVRAKGSHSVQRTPSFYKAPLRGALVIGADSEAALAERLRKVVEETKSGDFSDPMAPLASDLQAAERLAIDYSDSADLRDRAANALKALAANQPMLWKALRAQGIFRGKGPAPKVAFLYTGQGSQYVNMLVALRQKEPIVADIFAEADRVMTPLLGKPLSDFIFVDPADTIAVAKAEDDLRQTAITQPAVLATDIALTQLLAAYGIEPSFTMGHSLGEYGALVASGSLPFSEALEAVSARGREMTRVSLADKGRMAAVFAPLEQIEELLKNVDGYVVIANINSEHQAVIGGASGAVEQAITTFQKAGYEPVELPVSHAFHTSIVAPASEPLRRMLERLHLKGPDIPVIANVSGDFYPTGENAIQKMVDILARQVASPVQFVKGLRTLYDAGARVFVEVGPKKALQGFAEDVLGSSEVLALFTNHPKFGDVASFNQALCGMYAAGLGTGRPEEKLRIDKQALQSATEAVTGPDTANKGRVVKSPSSAADTSTAPVRDDKYIELGRLFADVLDRGWKVMGREHAPRSSPVVITGAALGLPGTEHVFEADSIARILRGDQFIDSIPTRFRRGMLDKNIIRLVKSENGGPTFEKIEDIADVIKLAGRGGKLDLEEEFGVSSERIAALDRATCLAIAAGIDALRDAGIPLVMRYKTTSKGTQLPDRWALPDVLRDETGVIFASAFPGYDSFAEMMGHHYADRGRRDQLGLLEDLRTKVAESTGHSRSLQEIDRRIDDLRVAIDKDPFVFDRRFLFKTLSMGHSQFAEFIGARGPNTAINAACASTTQAVSLAEDWINSGRCARVIVIAADDITSDNLLDWMGAGFLASGAAATDEVVEEAATPFDRRRHGMIVGMGAAALVIESAVAAHERGIEPICEVLGAVTANSAFHGTRLDVEHISQVMEDLVRRVEGQSGVQRKDIATRTVFVSHETYTPARGGSAAAEVHALRRVFGEDAGKIVVTNTKGFTGHAMGAGIEDVLAVKSLETSIVPPVPNFKEVDPELGRLNLSKGGIYPIEFALRLGAGFGSQISMTLMRWAKTKDGAHRSPNALGYAYRIANPETWDAWLTKIAGGPVENLEVVRHTLRVPDNVALSRNGDVPKVQTRAAAVLTSPAAVAVKLSSSPITEIHAPVSTPISAPLEAVRLPDHNAPQEETVKTRVLTLVSEKTGYPIDMLDLDLDLEADLGVDTVKQAEVFATIREAYGIPRDDKIKLRDFPTLAHVIHFVRDRRPDLFNKELEPSVPETEPVPVSARDKLSPDIPIAAAADSVKERILALVVEKTGYPQDMLDLDLDLEADLGVDTVKQAEMFAAIREIYSIPRDENRKLRDYPTLAHVIRFVYEKRPELKVPVLPIQPAEEQSPTQNVGMTAFKEISEQSIKEKVLEIVAAKTGYPPDMLDLDLDLEADLGIDTVKQAEMFAAVRAAYNIPRDENLKLRDFPTLAHVIKFAQSRRPGQEVLPVPSPPAAGMTDTHPSNKTSTSTASFVGTPRQVASFEAADRIPRRVPVPVLRPPLSICKPTGVTLGATKRIVLMADRSGVGEALTERLRRLRTEILRIEEMKNEDSLVAQLKGWIANGPIHGIYWLPALDQEEPLSGMTLQSWHDTLRVRIKALYLTMRTLNEQISSTDRFLISATRLGGQHGYDLEGALAPIGGSVTGFTKAYKRERPDALVKAVDFTRDQKSGEIAEALIEETLRDPGAVEIGRKGAQRWTVGLEERQVSDGRQGLTLDHNTVFMVTGAAGSIVSAITCDLAAASGGTFYLLDVASQPQANDPDLKKFLNDKEGLKRELFARIQAKGERATPALVEKELARLERLQAAQTAIEAVTAAGGTATYFSVDLTDAEAVNKVVREIKERSGRIDVLLHAAGIEHSHFLADKDSREFDLVFGVKADGWFNLLHAIGDMPLAATVAFSSIAGRFGNAGQTDYSAANDLLCKITTHFRTTRPKTRALAIDWTAWGGIGMATRGSIPKMMELAGIDMLPPEAGIPWIRRELTQGGSCGEIVVGQRLGVLLKEWEESGGLDPDYRVDTVTHGPMIDRIVRSSIHEGYTIETSLDPKIQPFLYDHQIDNTPVLPGVMGIEAFAEAALCALPGFHIQQIENIDFLAPFKFYRNEPRSLTIEARVYTRESSLLADCRLIGSRVLANQSQSQKTTHFTSRIRLGEQQPPAGTSRPPILSPELAVGADEIYRVYFHGPAYRVVQRAWWDGVHMVGLMARNLGNNHYPPELPTLAEPRWIELCFQTAGLWQLRSHGEMGLPQHLDWVRVWPSEKSSAELYAVVTPKDDGSFDAEVVDASGNVYAKIGSYRTVPFPIASEAAKKLQASMSPEMVAA